MIKTGEGIRTLDFQLGKQKADSFSPTKTQGKRDSQELPTATLTCDLEPDAAIEAIRATLNSATLAGLKVMLEAIRTIATIPGMTEKDDA